MWTKFNVITFLEYVLGGCHKTSNLSLLHTPLHYISIIDRTYNVLFDLVTHSQFRFAIVNTSKWSIAAVFLVNGTRGYFGFPHPGLCNAAQMQPMQVHPNGLNYTPSPHHTPTQWGSTPSPTPCIFPMVSLCRIQNIQCKPPPLSTSESETSPI